MLYLLPITYNAVQVCLDRLACSFFSSLDSQDSEYEEFTEQIEEGFLSHRADLDLAYVAVIPLCI